MQVGNDRGTQYRHGVYYHTDEQKIAAQEVFTKVESEVSPIEEDVRSFVCLYYHTEEQKEAALKVLQVLTEVETGVSSIQWVCLKYRVCVFTNRSSKVVAKVVLNNVKPDVIHSKWTIPSIVCA